jgi:hypothetical protein
MYWLSSLNAMQRSLLKSGVEMLVKLIGKMTGSAQKNAQPSGRDGWASKTMPECPFGG